MADERTEPRARLGPVAAFTVLYMAAALALSWRTDNAEFGIYIGVMLVLIAFVGFLHWSIGLSAAALWGLSVWGLMHMAGGLVPVPVEWPIEGTIRVLYSLWIVPGRLKFDHVVHVYGFFVTTWVCWEVMRTVLAAQTHRRPRDVRPPLGALILCAMASMGFGALNEVIEFAATQLVPETNVGGYVNTGWDLVSNMVGSMAAAVTIGVTQRGRAP